MSEPLAVNGVREGQPCWCVPVGDPAVPAHCPAAELVDMGYGHVYVLAAGRCYGPLEVFRDEASAVRAALERAGRAAAAHREGLAEAERVLAALEAHPESPVEVSDPDGEVE